MKLIKDLQNRFYTLKERDRRILLIGSITLGVIVLFGAILLPLNSAVDDARSRIQVKRDDLAWMRQNAMEIQIARNQFTAATGESPIVLIDRTGREAGLSNSLRGAQPSGIAGVRVQLESAPFDVLVTWLATVEQRYGLSLESITIDRAARPGLVNASVTFAQSKH